MDITEILLLILNLCELVAAITGFLLWPKFKNTYWQWFVMLLAFIFLTEMTAKFLKIEGSYKYLITDLYKYVNIPGMIISLILIMGRELQTTKIKNAGVLFTILYLLVFIAEELLLRHYFKKFNSLSYQVGFFLLLILSLISIFRLTVSSHILSFRQSLHFWVAFGLLIYYIPSLPLNAFRNSLFKSNYDTALFIWNTVLVLDIFMYLVFITGIILYDPKKFPAHKTLTNAAG